MSESRMGACVDMGNGRTFWPLDPRAEDIAMEDIAQSLSNVCRFGGRCREFYSVAQHSLLVARIASETAPSIAIHGLLHDAGEAYLGDVITPLKSALRVFRGAEIETFEQTERRVMLKVYEAIGIEPPTDSECDVVKRADAIALATEARDLMGDPRWPGLPPPDPGHVEPWSPSVAFNRFSEAFFELMHGRHDTPNPQESQ